MNKTTTGIENIDDETGFPVSKIEHFGGKRSLTQGLLEVFYSR